MTMIRVAAAVGAALGLALSGCSSSRTDDWRPSATTAPAVPSYATTAPDHAPKPRYPDDPDPCATYCLVWVPPTYRDVPKLVCCQPETCGTERFFRRKIDFEEVCTPPCYEKKCTPCRTHTEEVVEATPARREWIKTSCCGCDGAECYKPVVCPPTYKMCEKTVTEQGVEYCAYKPPQYDIVEHVSTVCVDRPVHNPGEYKVQWCKEEFQPGHWEWRRTMHCDCPTCPPKPNCGCGPSRRGDFSSAPAKD
jgi:hypothetical protein